MPACPTVRIKSTHAASQGEFVEINESDFDATRHELHVGAEPAPLPPPPLPPPPGPVNPLANLPKDWRDRKTSWLRDLAASVSGGRTPENREQAVDMIAAAVAAK